MIILDKVLLDGSREVTIMEFEGDGIIKVGGYDRIGLFFTKYVDRDRLQKI